MKAVNLLPVDLRAAERRGPGSGPGAMPEATGPLVILGVLAVVVVGVLLAVLSGNAVKDRQRELRAVQAEQVVAQREVDALAPYGTFRDLAVKRLSTVRELAGARFDWEQALRDLSRAVPSDVTLDLIQGTVTPGSSRAGASPNPLRTAIAAPAIELSGCTADQLEVARLMARLRAVQGVTRVSLASSKKEEVTAGGPAPTSTGPGGTTEGKRTGCGEGSQPEFEIVIFFESAAGGSAVAPAAPATTATAATPAATATPAPAGAPATAATPTPTPAATGQTASATTTAPNGTAQEVTAP